MYIYIYICLRVLLLLLLLVIGTLVMFRCLESLPSCRSQQVFQVNKYINQTWWFQSPPGQVMQMDHPPKLLGLFHVEAAVRKVFSLQLCTKRFRRPLWLRYQNGSCAHKTRITSLNGMMACPYFLFSATNNLLPVWNQLSSGQVVWTIIFHKPEMRKILGVLRCLLNRLMVDVSCPSFLGWFENQGFLEWPLLVARSLHMCALKSILKSPFGQLKGILYFTGICGSTSQISRPPVRFQPVLGLKMLCKSLAKNFLGWYGPTEFSRSSIDFKSVCVQSTNSLFSPPVDSMQRRT